VPMGGPGCGPIFQPCGRLHLERAWRDDSRAVIIGSLRTEQAERRVLAACGQDLFHDLSGGIP
jgi:hypothetical protein